MGPRLLSARSRTAGCGGCSAGSLGRQARAPGHATLIPATDARRVEDDYSRDGETPAQRLDRNYAELLQELRVAQTGVQILFAFLLSIAFQQRFTSLNHYERALYVVTLLLSSCSAVLLIAPAAVHRVLFRLHRKDELVVYGSRLAIGGLIALALAVLSAVQFALTVVMNAVFAVVATAALLVLVLLAWLVLPWRWRR